MHIRNPRFIHSLHLVKFSAAEDGMHVEADAKDENGKYRTSEPILTFRESESQILQLVIHGEKEDVVIPLSEIERAIGYAKEEVHCESHYDSPTENRT